MTDRDNETDKNKEGLSDEELYELEWGEDENSDGGGVTAQAEDDDSDDDGLDDSDQEKADEEETASSKAVATGEGDSPQGEQQPTPAEGADDDDPWAEAPAELKQAYLNAQNGLQAMKGRERATAQKASSLEKELQKAKAALNEATRERGPYETNHPELFDEVRKVMESKSPSKKGEAQSNATADQDGGDDDLQLVHKLHPDAGDILQSEEWASFEKSMSTAQREQYNSSDPADFIDLMYSYKTLKKSGSGKAKATDSDADLLKEADTSVKKASSNSKADAQKTVMTVDEAYDAEWAKEEL